MLWLSRKTVPSFTRQSLETLTPKDSKVLTVAPLGIPTFYTSHGAN
jgi:hypothetical protein